MDPLLNDMQRIVSGLRADKAPARNKAIEQLDQKLISAKFALNALLCQNEELSWTDVFVTVKEAILKHAMNIKDATSDKAVKPLVAKCYLYGNTMDHIIDYNLEMGRDSQGHFLSKSTIIEAFVEATKHSIVVRYFGTNFVNLLCRGIYLSPSYIAKLKVSEYSNVLSILFELNVNNDVFLESEIIKSIIKTVEIAKERTQLHDDLMAYLPSLQTYTNEAQHAGRKNDIVRLYHLFAGELAVNYHHVLCAHMQNVIPKLCEFYNEDVFSEATKQLFFEMIVAFLHALYPNLHSHDFTTFHVPVRDNWSQSVLMLRTIIEMEIRKHSQLRSKTCVLDTEKFSAKFIKMSALVVYIAMWHVEPNRQLQENPPKRVKIDQMKDLIELIHIEETSFNAVWFAIFAELLQLSSAIISELSYYEDTRETTLRVLKIYGNSYNLRNIRLCISSIMAREQRQSQSQNAIDFYEQVAAHLIADTRHVADLIEEKQTILQLIINYDKLSPKLCDTLLQSITTNELLKRNECIATIRAILIHAEYCGINKATDVIEPIIRWAYGQEMSYAAQIFNNIADIDQRLLADTLAIGVINFLDEQQLQQLGSHSNCPTATADNSNLQLLLYKYNKQLICLDDDFQLRLKGRNKALNTAAASMKSCLFLNNYELLMRMLDPPTETDAFINAMIKNLRSLFKLVCTLERLLFYNAFDASNYRQCPLIKRIGLLISRNELMCMEMKKVVQLINDGDLNDMINKLVEILEVFNSHEILINNLEKQPLQMLIELIGLVLNHHCTQTNKDRLPLSTQCFSILGSMCAIDAQSADAFDLITKNWKDCSPISDLLMIIKMLCRCKSLSNNCMEWLSEKLKLIFYKHYTSVDIMSQILDEIPTLSFFFYSEEHLLEVILIALNSLMKIALTKSYPTHLAVKIVRCVGQIAQRCSNIFVVDNFIVICKSVVNFISIPTLEVRYAAIETITLLLNANFCMNPASEVDTVSIYKLHNMFCEQIYTSIDFNKLASADTDMLLNTNSVTVQSLIAFFAFSTFHQEISVQAILSNCFSPGASISANNFCALDSLVPYCHELTMRKLLTPFADNLLHKWIALKRGVSKFPYFLCYNSKEEFLQSKAKSIIAYLFIYRTSDDIQRFSQLINEQEVKYLLKAYFLLALTDRAANENLTLNLKSRNLYPLDVALNAGTLYEMIRHLQDSKELSRLFGDCLSDNREKCWFNPGVESLFLLLNEYIPTTENKTWSKDARLQAMAKLMFEHKLVLVDLLGRLKTACHQAVLSQQVLQNFFVYCTIADAILNVAKTVESNTSTDLIQINSAYFVRDTWFFICRFQLHSKCEQLHRAAFEFMQLMLDTCTFPMHKNNTKHLDEIGKLLIVAMQHVNTQQLKMLASKVLTKFVNMYQMQLNMQTLMDELADTDEAKHLATLQKLCQTRLDRLQLTSLVDYVREFLNRNCMERLHGLREHIAKHKDELQNHEQLLFKLINRLIHMVRESPKEASSLEAVKCLAEIGPLKMKRNSYYFQTEFDDIQQQFQSSERPIVQFLSVIIETLEKHLYNFNTSTNEALIKVLGHVVNSKDGMHLVANQPNHHHLRIFHSSSIKLRFLNTSGNIPAINWLDVLKSGEKLDYEPFLCKLMGSVFGVCGWKGFDAFAANSFAFAKDCLQAFIKLLLSEKEKHLPSLCLMLDHFFASAANKVEGVYQDKRVIKQFLYICECIRLVNNWSIPINLGNAVKASNHCQAYFLSIMYLELWASKANEENNEKILDDEGFQMSAKIAYTSIGCLDAVPSFVDPLRSRAEHFSLNDNLSGILLASDDMGESKRQMCIDALKSNGMLSLGDLYQRSNVPAMQVDYEILWRLCKWEEPIDGYQKVNTSNDMEMEFKKHHYIALKSISKLEGETSVSAINNAYQCVQAILCGISVECLQSVYKYMTWLCMLQQSEDFCQIQFGHQMSSEQNETFFEKWRTELNLNYGNFKCEEQILAHQITLLKMPGTRAKRRIQQHYQQNPLETYLLKCIGECKAAGKLNLATKYIGMLSALPEIKMPTKVLALLEDADVNVKTGNPEIAKAILRHINTNNDFRYCVERVTALRMQGEFLLDSNAESFAKTLKTFKDSLKILEHFRSNKTQLIKMNPNTIDWDNFDKFEHDNLIAAHAAIAKYADREYQRLHDYCQSQEYKTLADIIQQNRSLANNTVTTHRSSKIDRDRQIGVRNFKSFANLDENELKNIEIKLTDYLCTAISHYISYCELDRGFSTPEIYRIIALWFTNYENEKMLEAIKAPIQLIPSYKFIGVVNQLAGRLNSKNAAFHTILVDLLVRCGTDHPQQTFYKLYPLVYAHMDGAYANTQRASIAKEIIARSCQANNAALQASKQFELMFPALIKFANGYLDQNNKVNTNAVPAMLAELNRLKLDLVQCPTIELPVQPSKKYNIISIVKWTGEFQSCGGLNAPLKLMCLCSDGVVRAQLIKGKDDLRQDAVMQQVFGIVNELFNSDSEFVERKLQLRTYKVTPLSTRCGIIEWVSNTMPIGTYLVGNGTGGAHMKYRPQDWNNNKCRQMAAVALKKPPEERRKVYKKICENVHPVFHYFLLEKFAIPGEWFERRLAYINSVATTSIVGYVLGLGDRHTQNILIDTQTAEVVHIDFGIAFEQGKIQATPETVPFRLTRDMVAPMGICGTNGVFTKSCEATMHILRRYKSVLITILEVLLYDPLFIWGVLSKEKQHQEQSSDVESKNLLAQRALLLVKHKLEGRETGFLESSDVKTQVQRLINEATLSSNLGVLFPGWDPYL